MAGEPREVLEAIPPAPHRRHRKGLGSNARKTEENTAYTQAGLMSSSGALKPPPSSRGVPSQTSSQRRAVDRFARELERYANRTGARGRLPASTPTSESGVSLHTISALLPFQAEFKAAGLAVTSAEQKSPLKKSAAQSVKENKIAVPREQETSTPYFSGGKLIPTSPDLSSTSSGSEVVFTGHKTDVDGEMFNAPLMKDRSSHSRYALACLADTKGEEIKISIPPKELATQRSVSTQKAKFQPSVINPEKEILLWPSPSKNPKHSQGRYVECLADSGLTSHEAGRDAKAVRIKFWPVDRGILPSSTRRSLRSTLQPLAEESLILGPDEQAVKEPRPKPIKFREPPIIPPRTLATVRQEEHLLFIPPGDQKRIAGLHKKLPEGSETFPSDSMAPHERDDSVTLSEASANSSDLRFYAKRCTVSTLSSLGTDMAHISRDMQAREASPFQCVASARQTTGVCEPPIHRAHEAGHVADVGTVLLASSSFGKSINNSMPVDDEYRGVSDRDVLRGLHIIASAAYDEKVDAFITHKTGVCLRQFLSDLRAFEALGGVDKVAKQEEPKDQRLRRRRAELRKLKEQVRRCELYRRVHV